MMIFIREFIRNQNLSIAEIIQLIAVQVASISAMIILGQVIVWDITH